MLPIKDIIFYILNIKQEVTEMKKGKKYFLQLAEQLTGTPYGGKYYGSN